MNYLTVDPILISVIVCLVVVVLGIVLFTIIRISKKNKFKQERKAKNNGIVLALGGRDNIVSFNGTGSRLSLVLKDYSLIEDEKLKELGVSSIIKMSNKITLVIGKDVQDIIDSLN